MFSIFAGAVYVCCVFVCLCVYVSDMHTCALYDISDSAPFNMGAAQNLIGTLFPTVIIIKWIGCRHFADSKIYQLLWPSNQMELIFIPWYVCMCRARQIKIDWIKWMIERKKKEVMKRCDFSGGFCLTKCAVWYLQT